jgi:hypothetical protein
MDLNNQSDTMRAFSGHLVSELMPVLKTAISQKKADTRRAGL